MHINHTTYDAFHTPSPYPRKGISPRGTLTTSSSPASTYSPFRRRTLPIEGDCRSPWPRSTASGTNKYKSRQGSADHNGLPWKRAYQYLKAKAHEFVEDYKAEPVDPSVWHLYKDYRRERKLWKKWREQERHRGKKRQISQPMPQTQTQDRNGAGPYARCDSAQRKLPTTPDKGRETKFVDFIHLPSKEWHPRIWGRKGVDDDDASFCCVGVDPSSTYLTPEPAPTPAPTRPPPISVPQSKRSSSSSNYSPLSCSYCHKPACGDYRWVLCRDCIGGFNSPLTLSGTSTNASPRPSSRTTNTSTLDSVGSTSQVSRESDIPMLYSPQLDSHWSQSSKTHSADDRGRQHRREAQLLNGRGNTELKTPTKRRGCTKGGVSTSPRILEDEIMPTESTLEGMSF
ncbi:MAG: hypothetical protein M1813_001880 [Trichoglossum hirsutum]|nr:MAG: hypothetical protein M1813_001880 [Trichoglossum hirsutum]